MKSGEACKVAAGIVWYSYEKPLCDFAKRFFLGQSTSIVQQKELYRLNNHISMLIKDSKEQG